MPKKLNASGLDQVMDDIDVPASDPSDPLGDEDGVTQVPQPRAKRKTEGLKLTPEQLQARIDTLEREVAKFRQAAPPELPEDPDGEVTVQIPLTATGYPISINGKKYFGKMTVKRRVLDTILSMLGNHAQIQSELTQKRGTQVRMAQLAPDDTVSRIQQRRMGRHILDGAAT